MTGPQAYDEVSDLSLPDALNRYQQLNDRDSMARAIATLQARGEWNDDRSLNPADYPPLTVAGHLELIALGERLARHYRHPAQVHHAILAGATWSQIAAATGGCPDQARQAYAGWAEQQHRLRLDFPGGTIGLGDDEYAAAAKAAGEPATDAPAEDTRRLAAIRSLLSRFEWEHDDRQFALEAIERIVDGGQA
jgi:hypothetical protein